MYLIRLSFNEMKSKLSEFDVAFYASLDEKVGNTIVMVDPVRLKQVLYNLLSNAIKFTHDGYINFGYRLVEKSMLEFWVKDTGVGIPAEQLSSMFERFRQAEHSDHKRYGGTGLGLSISKNLCQLMGGDMYAESIEGEGSTFYFTIPYFNK